MKRKTILAAMVGMTITGVGAAGPASAQQYDGGGGHAYGDHRNAGHHGVSEHDHYAAWVTQQRKLRVQHQRWAQHQQGQSQSGRWHDDGGWHDGNR